MPRVTIKIIEIINREKDAITEIFIKNNRNISRKSP